MKGIIKPIITWLLRKLSAKCPECGEPMVMKKYETTVKGESFPVFHCTGCHHEYILK